MTSNYFTPIGTVGYSSLFKAKGSPLNPAKLEFCLLLLFTPKDLATEDAKRTVAALTDLARSIGGANVQTAIKAGKFRWPFKPVDHDNGKGWPREVTEMINLKSGADYPPKIVDMHFNPILDPNQIYPGCRMRASINFYGYPAGRSPIPGVGAGMNNVQLVGDGPRLAGARGDGSEFGSAGKLAPDEDDFDKLT